MAKIKMHKIDPEVHAMFHTYFGIARFKNTLEIQFGRRVFRIVT